MPIVVGCSCGQRFAAKDSLAGKTVKCPKCGSPIHVPAPGETTPPPVASAGAVRQAVPPPQPPVNSIGDILDEVEKEHLKNLPKCMRCEAILPKGENLCPKCGFDARWLPKEEKKKEEKPKSQYGVEGARPPRRRERQYSSGGDDELGALEYLLCFFCSGIACILGVIYVVTGDSRGPKLIMFSIIFAVIKNIIGVALHFGLQGGAQ